MLQKTQIDNAMEQLVAACGFDQSNSNSEMFAYAMQDALHHVLEEIDDCHDDFGACYDASHAIASRLENDRIRRSLGLGNDENESEREINSLITTLVDHNADAKQDPDEAEGERMFAVKRFFRYALREPEQVAQLVSML